MKKSSTEAVSEKLVGKQKFASWARIENYNLAWVPRWGRGVNLSSTPRQRRRFGVYMASGKPLRPFLKGCSEGQKVAVSEDRGEHMIIASDTTGFYGGEGMSLRACQGFLCGQSRFLPPPVCKFISVNLHPSWRVVLAPPCALNMPQNQPKSILRTSLGLSDSDRGR